MKINKFLFAKKIEESNAIEFDHLRDLINKNLLKEEEQAPQQELPKPEANKLNPQIMSTNPEVNVCPAYLLGYCRVSGNPCIFNNANYKTCGLYNQAVSTDPNLFEIYPGREQSQEYMLGIKF